MAARLIACSLLAAACSLASGSAWDTGVRHYAAEDYRKAQASFEDALAQDPQSPAYNLWLGHAIGRRLQAMSAFRRIGAMPLARKVKRQYEKAVELDGGNLNALGALMEFLLGAPSMVGGSKSDARKIAERIGSINAARGAAAMAACHQASGELEEARDQFALARQIEPENLTYILAHAEFLAGVGEHSDSDELLDLAFRREGDNPAVWVAAARAWSSAGRKDRRARARALVQHYLETPKTNPDAEPYFIVRALLKQLSR